MRLPKILLGIESIGNNRHERVIRLTERLRELGAYQWLSAQSAYGDALETLNRIAKTDPEYAKDIREFLLLSSLVQPFQLLLFERIHNFDPPYPTVNEVKSARANANNLLEFLHNKGSIYGVIDVPIMLEGALKKFERAVSEITRTYRKPRNDKTIRERDYRDRLIRSIYGYFGKCSPALISKLLTLVDYEHDVRELNKHIKNLTDKSRRKATVATL